MSGKADERSAGQCYEYIKVLIDLGDLSQLNRFGREGWRLITVVDNEMATVAILERTYDEH